MSSTAPTYPRLGYGSSRLPPAAFEVLIYLAGVAVASLFFLAGWLSVNGSVVLTVVLCCQANQGTPEKPTQSLAIMGIL